jgi:hypothetical protein
LIALLAVLQQMLLFALAVPTLPAWHDAGYGLASAHICGTSPSADHDGPHKSQDAPQDCQTCPLCQALVFAGLSLSPRGVPVPIRSASVLYRLHLPTERMASGISSLAAQPRGPPSNLT